MVLSIDRANFLCNSDGEMLLVAKPTAFRFRLLTKNDLNLFDFIKGFKVKESS